ncbi:polysaccharide biosynthesis tyrosine autokinase [Aeromicrobium chenweiae]|uniref:non-specific protein-tyrosine kinase n=1 Tax=Aeromicrobium chenweiae TaxID=2079793 RepID=A0A2S0WIY9_9ACTN|nr:polysaccharide biosynthesis tyrosine autokinase [Aeromicrobium chenweiae]AWB91200.1 capsular biosynthesis protein [Aeromicrobium chenweiae]TGN31719.1 polysaccharide biosynthesis tyrosine autokinase [Aeromicrobium chenweiae]
MGLQDYLRIFRDRWLTICATTIVAVLIALIVTASATPMYKSSSRLFVTTAQSGSSDAYQGGLFSQQRVKSYANLLTGEEISRRVVEKLNLDESPRSLSSRISASVQPDTVVLTISVVDPSPTQARRLAQATAQEFVTYVAELETTPGKSRPPVKASIVDRATTPAGAFSPRPLRNLAVALVLGLLAGCGLAVLRDRLDNRVRSEDDLAQATNGAPVLGNIHYDKQAVRSPLIRDLGSHDPRVEAFRVLRTNLQFINVDVAHKVFVITSAVPGEGKSSTACNLAESLASAGESVLLIEGDLRRPRATEYLGLENAVGVTTVLVGRVSFGQALQRAGDGFDLLASGRVPPNPAELLQSTAMLTVLHEARELYDVVLIDAPPLLPVTDAAVLATESDGALLVVRHNSTSRDQVGSSLARLESVGARLLGTIVTMSPRSRRASSAYGYGYGYGYEPDSGGEQDTDLERVARR